MKLNNIFKDVSIGLYVLLIAIVLGATVYQMFVIIPEFTRSMPDSMIQLATSQVKPSNFWGSPIIILSGLLLPIIALIFNWKTARRKYILLAFAFGIAASVFTTIYFIPRLKIMGLFESAPTTNTVLLIQTIKQWIFADHFRFWLTVVPSFFFAVKAAMVSSERLQKVLLNNA